MVLNDKWLIKNGYLKVTIDNTSTFSYEIITQTEKFKKLYDTCRRIAGIYGIITPELIISVIESGKTKRTYIPKYKKKPHPEGWMSTKDKIALRKKETAERKLKNANRKPK